MTTEIVMLTIGLAIGGVVVWFMLREMFRTPPTKQKRRLRPCRATLAERLQAKEEQIERLTGSLDKASDEIKGLQSELKSESEKRATAEEKNTRIP